MSGVRIIHGEDLPLSNIAREFVGADHGGVGVCVIVVEAEPGRGPSLHEHPYEEVLILLDGEATVQTGGEELVARSGDVVVIPAGQPHGFVNSGDGPLRQIDIHVSPHFDTRWLED
jgi:quercetin dioxygenase-like cupin family protein